MIAKELKKHHVLGNVSLHTVQEVLQRDLGYQCCWLQKKPLINDQQKKRRFLLAKKYRDGPLNMWQSVVEWQEPFCVSGWGSTKVHHHPSSDSIETCYTQRTTKHPPSLVVWDCFSYCGVGDLEVLPKNTIKCEQSGLFSTFNDHLEDYQYFQRTQIHIFQQDRTSCHS